MNLKSETVKLMTIEEVLSTIGKEPTTDFFVKGSSLSALSKDNDLPYEAVEIINDILNVATQVNITLDDSGDTVLYYLVNPSLLIQLLKYNISSKCVLKYTFLDLEP